MAEKSHRKPRVFILGVSGFLGFRLALYLRKNFSVTGGYFSTPVHLPDCHFFPVHFRDYDSFEQQIERLRPDFTVMAAGITRPTEILKDLKVAEAVNALLPLSFSLAAMKNKCKNIHLSCSEVFEGHQGNYKEDDRATSMDEIHRFKGEAEAYVKAQTTENTVVRFGRVLGAGHPYRLNFFDQARASFLAEKPLLGAARVSHSYLSAQSFCEAIEKILLSPIPAKNRHLHIGGVKATEAEVLKEIARRLGKKDTLVQETGDQADTLDYSLNSDAFSAAAGWKAEKTLAEVMDRVMSELRANPGVPPPAKIVAGMALKPAPKSAQIP